MSALIILGLIALIILLCGCYSYFSEGPVIYWFYMPGCGYCKRMEGEWAKFEKSSPIEPRRVDITIDKNRKLADDFGVHGVPHIVKVIDGKRTVYEGDRTADALMKFVKV